ncbi:hypothetical protein OOT33_05390 [Sphingobium sp. DEHP117]|uniref:hypothetical protein n=1 Tax=Sphingobium sp. DEHP117 TaxID=2993436 RepID=UPI0027D759B3|nr:hypothetical protein [Sphingobium sp. DEHP117]MDQ4419874.1 hypothetical protein [Sphingobium sp. DEHP117]
MATASSAASTDSSARPAESSFFTICAVIMGLVIVAGFSVNLAMGRSTFAVPPIYHVHALVFFGWVALYLAQTFTIARGHIRLHRALGKVAYAWAPAMVVLGIAMLLTSMRRMGGPPFFDQREFLFSNCMMLVLFAILTITALRMPRSTGWHPRLMLTGMALLVNPGIGRLLPLPYMIPYAWLGTTMLVLVFPIAGMIADKRRTGRVHPAWAWGIGAILLTQLVADVLAFSDWGAAVTQAVVAGTPGAQRPMEAFLPPGF